MSTPELLKMETNNLNKRNKNLGNILEKRRKGRKHLKTFYLGNSLKERKNQFMKSLLAYKATLNQIPYQCQEEANLNIQGKQQQIKYEQKKILKSKRNISYENKARKKQSEKKQLSSELNNTQIERWKSEIKQTLNIEAQIDFFEYKQNFSSPKSSHNPLKDTCAPEKVVKNFLGFTARDTKNRFRHSDCIETKKYIGQNIQKNSQNVDANPLKYKSNLMTPIHRNQQKLIESTNKNFKQDIQNMKIIRIKSQSNKKIQNQIIDTSQDKKKQQDYKKYKSSLQKCRLMTQSYDELKDQIITRIKIKKSMKPDPLNLFPIHNYRKSYWIGNNLLKEKQNRFQIQKFKKNQSSQEKRLKIENRSNLNRMIRYADISVAQFLDKEDQTCIDSQVMKKIQEMKKQVHRPRSKTQ